MKLCRACDTEKPEAEFNRRGKGLQSQCRSCQRAWYEANLADHKANAKRRTQRHRRDVHVALTTYKAERGCADCPEADPVVLDFDHLSDKIMNVSEMARRGFSLERIMAEVAKCEVVCANCHRRRTHRRKRALDDHDASCPCMVAV